MLGYMSIVRATSLVSFTMTFTALWLPTNCSIYYLWYNIKTRCPNAICLSSLIPLEFYHRSCDLQAGLVTQELQSGRALIFRKMSGVLALRECQTSWTVSTSGISRFCINGADVLCAWTTVSIAYAVIGMPFETTVTPSEITTSSFY